MMKKNKNILIFLSIGIVLIVSIFFSFNKKEYHELPKVKLKEPLKNKQFALMLEQDNGEYLESAGELPTEGYVFNANKSGCTDVNGKIIDGALNYDYENYTIILNTDKTSYCYLYYDIEPNIKFFRSKDTGNYLTKELAGGMYRYQGSFLDSDSSSMTNWICFGTNNQEECKSDIDKYMYRIIGINAKGQLYLLKETFIKEGEVTGFAWNDETKTSGSDIDVCPNGICPEWNEADLFLRINGIANGKTAGNGNTNDGKDDDTDIFVDSTYYDYLKSGDKVNGGEEASDWYKLIVDHEWYYGDTIDILYRNTSYDIETGKLETQHYVKGEDGIVTSQPTTWENTVTAKISLMYLHDISYAYPGGNPNILSNIASSWIHFRLDGYNDSNNYEWLSTRWGIGNAVNMGSIIYARRVLTKDDLGGYGYHLANGYGVRPVFYVTNNINLSGNGTKENPFVIGM